MVIYWENKRIVGLVVLLGCVMGLRGMRHEPRAPKLTMAQHKELLDFVHGARDSGMAFPGICALCAEEFPQYSKLAQMYAYFHMAPIERNQYEDSPEFKQLRPEEFLRCCPDFSFVSHEMNALRILDNFAWVVTMTDASKVLADVAIGLIEANDILFMRYFMDSLGDKRPRLCRVSPNFFCDNVLTGSVMGVRLLLRVSKLDVNQICRSNKYGETLPLLLAVMRGHLPMVKLLLRHGAYPELRMRCDVQMTVAREMSQDDSDVFSRQALIKSLRQSKRLCSVAEGQAKSLRMLPDVVRDSVGRRTFRRNHPGYDVYEGSALPASALAFARNFAISFAGCPDNQYPAIIACLERAIAAKHAKVASVLVPTCVPSSLIEPSECVGDVPAAGSSSGAAMVVSASAGHVDQSSGGAPADAMRTVRTAPDELLEASSGRQPSIVDCSGWGCGCRVKKVKKVVEKDKDKKDKKKK